MKNWRPKIFRRSAAESLDCHTVAEQLQLYLDHEIEQERSALIAAHLDYCRKCGLEADAYEQIKSTLASQRQAVPDESVQRLRAFGRGLLNGEQPAGPEYTP